MRVMMTMILAWLALAAPAAAAAFRSDRIEVRTEGAGPDVILIPGLTSSPSAWRTLRLSNHRLHLIQVKGFAGTKPEGNATGPLLPALADEIARYAAEAKLDRPAVIGHSMGGTVGLMLAARHPDAIGRLMVVDQLPFMGVIYGPPGTTATSVRPTADKVSADLAALPTEAYHQSLARSTASMVRDTAQRATVLEEAKASDRAVVGNAFHELIVTDLGPELPAITAPVTVLYVTPADLPLNDAQVDAVYRAAYAPLPNGRLVRVPDSAHFIMSDNPARFAAEVERFLER